MKVYVLNSVVNLQFYKTKSIKTEKFLKLPNADALKVGSRFNKGKKQACAFFFAKNQGHFEDSMAQSWIGKKLDFNRCVPQSVKYRPQLLNINEIALTFAGFFKKSAWSFTTKLFYEK